MLANALTRCFELRTHVLMSWFAGDGLRQAAVAEAALSAAEAVPSVAKSAPGSL